MFQPLPAFPRISPPLPFNSLPEPIRGAVLQMILEKDIPAVVAFTDAISAVAAVVHCGYDCVAPDGEHLPTTINTCVLAPSADGKGRSIRTYFRRFIEAQVDWQIKRADELAQESDSESASKTKTKNKPKSKAPAVEAMINKSSFVRLMQEIHGHCKNLTIQREEGFSFLKSDLFMKDTDALTQLWSGNPPLDHFVNGKELVAADARVSLGFRIQPDLMYKYLRTKGRDAVKLGFWPRTIAGCYDPERFPENQWDPPHQTFASDGSEFQARIDELADEINNSRAAGCRQRIGVPLDQNATGFMLELGHRMKQWRTTYYQDIREAAGRAWENTLRLATVLHVFCNGSGPAPLDMVRRAWDVIEWSLSQHRLIFVSAMAINPKAHGAGYIAPPHGVHQNKPKREKMPLHLRDAEHLLICLDRLRFNTAYPLLTDLRTLSGQTERRFRAALEWLKLERIVQMSLAEPYAVFRIR
ncbi:MAG: hypothetical protein ABS98_03930 [Lysobacteraceae bacterium SCN 69-48]|nr:MAG: hypothetical protein ABS98_03930 [Xanthomonadaceae bacterium SCN 69-48]